MNNTSADPINCYLPKIDLMKPYDIHDWSKVDPIAKYEMKLYMQNLDRYIYVALDQLFV